MCPQKGLPIDVVCIRQRAAGVVWREAQGVEVLLRRDYGAELVVVFVCRLGEVGLNNISSNGDGMVVLEV